MKSNLSFFITTEIPNAISALNPVDPPAQAVTVPASSLGRAPRWF